MPLKDYTTTKEPDATIQDITKLLKGFGIRGIMSEYDDSENIICMSFKINIDGVDMGFRLPTDWKPVLEVFKQDKKTPRRCCNEAQARRTAWRIIYHWIDAQLALVRIKMVKIEIIFLPYVVANDGRTLAEHFEEAPMTLLN